MNKFKSVYLTSRSFICMTGQVLAPALGWSSFFPFFFFFFFYVKCQHLNVYLSFSTQGILVGS